jgi:hypothetical protein
VVGGHSGAEADFDDCAGSQSNSLDLALGQPLLRAVVKPGGARALVRRHWRDRRRCRSPGTCDSRSLRLYRRQRHAVGIMRQASSGPSASRTGPGSNLDCASPARIEQPLDFDHGGIVGTWRAPGGRCAQDASRMPVPSIAARCRELVKPSRDGSSIGELGRFSAPFSIEISLCR